MCQRQKLAHKFWAGLVDGSPVELTVADIPATADVYDHGEVGPLAVTKERENLRAVARRACDGAAGWIGARREGLQGVEYAR